MDGQGSIFVVMPIVIMLGLAALIGLPSLADRHQARASTAARNSRRALGATVLHEALAVSAAEARRVPAAGERAAAQPVLAAPASFTPDRPPAAGHVPVAGVTLGHRPGRLSDHRVLRAGLRRARRRRVLLAATASAAVAAAWIASRLRRP